MNLGEVFSQEFIQKLNALNRGHELDMTTEVDGYIDIKDILEKLGFQIVTEDMNASGRIKKNIIYIDSKENSNRQRFSMAHELGHAMKGERQANRLDVSEGYAVAEKRSETFANTFAAQFLMPKVLVVTTIDKVIKEFDLNSKCLSVEDIKIIQEETAKRLRVSEQAMKYRIENLAIFSPVEENHDND